MHRRLRHERHRCQNTLRGVLLLRAGRVRYGRRGHVQKIAWEEYFYELSRISAERGRAIYDIDRAAGILAQSHPDRGYAFFYCDITATSAAKAIADSWPMHSSTVSARGSYISKASDFGQTPVDAIIEIQRWSSHGMTGASAGHKVQSIGSWQWIVHGGWAIAAMPSASMAKVVDVRHDALVILHPLWTLGVERAHMVEQLRNRARYVEQAFSALLSPNAQESIIASEAPWQCWALVFGSLISQARATQEVKHARQATPVFLAWIQRADVKTLMETLRMLDQAFNAGLSIAQDDNRTMHRDDAVPIYGQWREAIRNRAQSPDQVVSEDLTQLREMLTAPSPKPYHLK